MLRAKLGGAPPPSRKADSRAKRRGLSLHPALHFGGGRYLVSHFRAEWRPQRAPEIKSKETIRTCLIQTGAKVSFDCDCANFHAPLVTDAI